MVEALEALHFNKREQASLVLDPGVRAFLIRATKAAAADHLAAHCDLAQQRVECGAVAPLVNWVDPDEHTIDCGELCSHGVEDIVLVDHRFRIDADVSERREDSLEPAAICRGTTASSLVAAWIPCSS